MADPAADPGRLCFARAARGLRGRQKDRLSKRTRAVSGGTQRGRALMSLELMAPLMFGGLVVFLLLGYPVAFSLAANGLFFGLIGMQLDLLHPSLLHALPERVLGIMSNPTPLAIPVFIFMGLILKRSVMTEDLLDTIGPVFGLVRAWFVSSGALCGRR